MLSNHTISITLLISFFIFPLSEAKWNPFSVTTSSSGPSKPFQNSYQLDTDDYDDGESPEWTGLGRELNLFDARGGESAPNTSRPYTSAASAAPSSSSPSYHSKTEGLKRRRRRSSSSASTSSEGQYYGGGYYSSSRVRPGGSLGSSPSRKSPSDSSLFSSVRQWITSGNLPTIQCKVEPNTTLKVRKTFRPLGTLVRLGANFNAQLGVWQFQSSWQDRIIGGKLTLAGRELQFVKTWLLSVGAVEDLVTRLRLRAAVDLGTMKAYARLGFRTERLSPINVVEGFTLLKRLPLDGNKGHVKLEVKANFAFPEPEIEYSTENHRSLVGMGDIEVCIDELNLLLDY